MTKLLITSNADLSSAWAAGIFEGEGSISFTRGAIRLKVGMTDGDVVKRFQEVMGCGSLYVREEMRKEHWKACWYWQADKHSDCVEIMGRLLPFLGERRTARWHEVCSLREARRPETVCPQCGVTFKPIRMGQICCGHDCSWRYCKAVGPFSGRKLNGKSRHRKTLIREGLLTEG